MRTSTNSYSSPKSSSIGSRTIAKSTRFLSTEKSFTAESEDSLISQHINEPYIIKKSSKEKKFNTDLLVKQVEEDMKTIDSSFEFGWDDELSFIYAAKCIKQATQRLIIEKESLKVYTSGNYEMKMLELRRLEKSLYDREKRIQSAENSINFEKIRVDNFNRKLKLEDLKNKQEKSIIEEKYKQLNEENLKIIEQMKKNDEKYQEFMKNITTHGEISTAPNTKVFHEKEKQIEEREKLLDDKEKEINMKIILFEEKENSFNREYENKSKDLQQIEQKLNEKEILLASQYEENIILHEKLKKLNQEYFSNSTHSTNTLESKIFEVKNEENLLIDQKIEAEEAMSQVEKELSYIESIKQALFDQQDEIAKEQLEFKNQYSIKIEELIKSHEIVQNKLKNIGEKEILIKEIMESVNEKEQEVENSWNLLKNTENIKEDYEKLLMAWEDIQIKFLIREKTLEAREMILKLKEENI